MGEDKAQHSWHEVRVHYSHAALYSLRKLFLTTFSKLANWLCSVGNVDGIQSCFPNCGSTYLVQFLCPSLPFLSNLWI